LRSFDARAALAALLLSACGARASTPAAAPPDAGADTAARCALEPTGAFTFHVHNAGATDIIVDLGCGRALPIVLATPSGRLPIGPGGVDSCEFTCDQIYAGQRSPGGCTDCGGGVSQTVAPGATADIGWDRRVYALRTVEAGCAQATGSCAFGQAVAPMAAQLGVLTTCPADQQPTSSCLTPTSTEFTVDTTGDAATIDVGR
jgi:hypothetical protein